MRIYIILFYLFSLLSSVNAAEREVIPMQVTIGKYQLAGEISKPMVINSSQKIPAIIFVVGSGESSYLKNYRTFNQYFFTNPFQENDVAIVNFDKRGIGASTGKWYTTTIEQRAEDTYKVANYIKQLDFIDPNKIFVVGHSQGGWIAQYCLIHYPNTFAGGVSMAGATFSVKKQLINDFQSQYICQEKLDNAIALKKAKKRVNKIFTVTSLFPVKKNWKQLKKIRKFSIEHQLNQITKPFLYMWASNDQLVNPQWSMEVLNQQFNQQIPSNISTYIGNNQNHSFEISAFCPEKKKSEYSEESRDFLVSWLNQQFKSK